MKPVFMRATKQLTAALVQQIEDDFQARNGAPKSDLEISTEQIREAAAAGLQASSGVQ